MVRLTSPALLRYFERRVRPAEDAADLLGETLLVLWRRVDAIPRDDAEARMWMFGVARRVLLRHLRQAVRGGELVERLRDELMTGRDAGAAESSATDRAELVAALARLAPRDREIVMLVAWDGFSLAEVARHLRVPGGTVRSRYSRARASLRRTLDADPGDDGAIATRSNGRLRAVHPAMRPGAGGGRG
ncbi:sigma-70 family RNA polymerase sigma factor [Schumannella sp. 10F1B-5-1]|nr:sigma-70 family RNA polymerase sigma factor [Schumannella sp. 10F1B-5-1]